MSLFTQLRPADLIDILLLAAFLFVAITWVRRSASRQAVIALVIIVALWVVTRYFNMYLTQQLIRWLLLALSMAWIVVFQSDIRRMVDRMGNWGTRRGHRVEENAPPVINLLVEACGHFAEEKIGALIAIRGRDPWDRLIEGGVPLEGRPSLPLLYSLFHPATPGHDGAMLIRGDSIICFGAHLPLSSNLGEVGDAGTRHTAGLGLCELCDALVMVVSEERGTISIAQDGKIAQVEAAELKGRLESFWDRHYSPHNEGRLPWWRRAQPVTAVLALLMAIGARLLIAGQPETIHRSFAIPIELRNMPEALAIEEPPPEARITLSGSDQAFRLLNPTGLVVSLDMERLEPGRNEFAIAEDNLRLPGGVTLFSVQPQPVVVWADRMREVVVPIKARWAEDAGAPPHWRLRPQPGTVAIMLPESRAAAGTVVETEPIDLKGVTPPATVRSRLVIPEGTQLVPNQDPEIEVRIEAVEPEPAGKRP